MPSEPLPATALAWLLDGATHPLLLAASPPLVHALAAAGSPPTVVAPDSSSLRRAVPDERYGRAVVGLPDALPLAPYRCDAAVCWQNLHTLSAHALAEIARVLTLDGHLAVAYLGRDDSVPWVKRLAARIQQVDPTAMRGDYGSDAVDSAAVRRYFPDLERRLFRTWLPASRDDLLAMVAARDIPTSERTDLLRDVGALYDDMARPPQPLLLPYELMCFRGQVHQEELSHPITIEDGLRIL